MERHRTSHIANVPISQIPKTEVTFFMMILIIRLCVSVRKMWRQRDRAAVVTFWLFESFPTFIFHAVHMLCVCVCVCLCCACMCNENGKHNYYFYAFKLP